MSDEGKQAMQSRSHGLANRYQQAALAWREVPVPVIAALHGVAFGGGLQIPLGADIRISAPDTKFSLMEVRWGIVPDMAGTVLLRSIVREDVLRELIEEHQPTAELEVSPFPTALRASRPRRMRGGTGATRLLHHG